MLKCASCGGEVSGQNFCPQCGAAQAVVLLDPIADARDVAAEPTELFESIGAPSISQSTGLDLSPNARFTISLVPERYVRAGVAALVSYATAWVVALVCTALTLIGLPAALANWSWLFEAPGQLVGLALGGVLSAGTSLAGVTASVSLMWLPVIVTVAFVVAVVVASRRDEQITPTASRLDRLILSLVTGAVTALLALIVSAILPILATAGSTTGIFSSLLSAQISASAASPTLLLGSFVLGTLVAYLSRAKVARAIAPPLDTAPSEVIAAIRATLPVISLYLILVAVLVSLVIVVSLVSNGGISMLSSLLLWLPMVVLNSFGLVNLSTSGVSGSMGAALTSGGGAPGLQSLWLPSVLPAWGVVVLLAVDAALILAIGVVLRLRRDSAVKPSISWMTTVISFTLAGAAISILGSAAVWTHVDATGLGGALGGLLGSNSYTSGLSGLGGPAGSALSSLGSTQGAYGPAAWTFIIFAILGGLVEASATFLAPSIIPRLSPQFIKRGDAFLSRIGTPLRSSGAITAESDTADYTPLLPEQKKRLKIVAVSVGGVVAFIVLATITVSILNQSYFSPSRLVADYLDSFVSGKASQALEIGNINTGSLPRTLLTDSVLKSNPSRITNYTITSSSTSGDESRVVANIHRGQAKSTEVFTLQRQGSTWIIFDAWKMKPTSLPMVSAQVKPSATSVIINGVALKTTASERSAGFISLPAFPGEYTVAFGGNSKWVTAASTKVTVSALTGESPARVEFVHKPTEALVTSLNQQVAAYLAACAAQTVLNPTGCPFYYYSYSTPSQVQWSIVSTPTISLKAESDGTFSVSSDDSGDAHVSFVDTGFFSSSTANSEDSNFSLAGTVSLDTGSPVFTADASASGGQ